MNWLLQQQCQQIALTVLTNDVPNKNAQLSLICINYNDWTYLFDYLSIYQEEPQEAKKFIRLIGNILNDSMTQKIVFAGQFILDLFFHQYNIVCNNFIDISVRLFILLIFI